MNYQSIYDKIITRARNRVINNNDYYELHHIKPKCMGGLDIPENLVHLTASEHYICHLLLSRLYPNNIGLIRAVMFMSSCSWYHKQPKNKTYSIYRQKFHEYYMNKRIKRNCQVCNKAMLVVKNLEKTKKYCSKECLTESNRTAKDIEINCKNCNKKIIKKSYTSKVFCCMECYDEYRGKHLVRRKQTTKKNCLFCSKEMELMPHLKDQKFCSHSCSRNYRKK